VLCRHDFLNTKSGGWVLTHPGPVLAAFLGPATSTFEYRGLNSEAIYLLPSLTHDKGVSVVIFPLPILQLARGLNDVPKSTVSAPDSGRSPEQ